MRFIGAGTRAGVAQVDHDRIFTVPNAITVIRFLGVPLFVWLVLAKEQYGWGVLVLVIMGSTDWVDGYIARRFDQGSKLGRVLDPLADRVALIVVAITLVIAQVAPWWLLAIIVVPDAVLMATSLLFFRWHPDLPVSVIGKLRTAALLVGTPLLLLAKALGSEPNVLTFIAWAFLIAGIVGHLIAAYNYFWAIVRKHRRMHLPPGASGTQGSTGGPKAADS